MHVWDVLCSEVSWRSLCTVNTFIYIFQLFTTIQWFLKNTLFEWKGTIRRHTCTSLKTEQKRAPDEQLVNLAEGRSFLHGIFISDFQKWIMHLLKNLWISSLFNLWGWALIGFVGFSGNLISYLIQLFCYLIQLTCKTAKWYTFSKDWYLSLKMITAMSGNGTHAEVYLMIQLSGYAGLLLKLYSYTTNH